MEFPAWDATEEGPVLEGLTRRVAECPPEFLGEPLRPDGRGDVHVAAVVSDLLSAMGGRPLTEQEAERLAWSGNPEDKTVRNRLRCTLVAAWLLADASLRGRPRAERARGLLLGGIDDMADHMNGKQLITQPDRREELARTLLLGLALRPAGESVAVAQDRLTTISSAERARVVREARAAEERARAVREALRRKAEEEAAAAYGRE